MILDSSPIVRSKLTLFHEISDYFLQYHFKSESISNWRNHKSLCLRDTLSAPCQRPNVSVRNYFEGRWILILRVPPRMRLFDPLPVCSASSAGTCSGSGSARSPMCRSQPPDQGQDKSEFVQLHLIDQDQSNND